MSVLKAFRLSEETVEKLKTLSKATRRSERFYVEEALELYLTDYADAQIAKERFNSPGTTMISGKELRKRLGV